MPNLLLAVAEQYDGGIPTTMRGPEGLFLCTWHTVEAGYDRDPMTVARYLRSTGADTHLIFNPVTGAVVQMLDGDQGARTLEDDDWPLDPTNTWGERHVQIEVLGYAEHPWTDDLTPAGRETLRKIIAWLRQLGVPDRWSHGIKPPVYPGPGVPKIQPTESGHFHHAGWVDNNHGDPGAIMEPWLAMEETMAQSFNGLTVLESYPPESAWFTSPAPGFHQVVTRNRAFAVLFEAVARRWHNNIEPIAAQHQDNWFPPRERKDEDRSGNPTMIGIHCYRPPGTNVGTGDQSNHTSASAMDINGHLHPYEVSTGTANWYDGFTNAQEAELRAIKAQFTDGSGNVILRLGLDFAIGKRDGMHTETAPGVTTWQVAQAAKKLEEYVGRSSTAPVWFRNAKGLDVLEAQKWLDSNGFDPEWVDGKAGAMTERAVMAFQKAAGLTVDGRWGPATDAATATYKPTEPEKPVPEPTPEPEPEPMPEPTPVDPDRISGTNRFATAALFALKQWPNGCGPVYLIEAWDSAPDAMVGASAKDGPILYVTDTLPAATAEAIQVLRPSTIIPLGGRVSHAVADEARRIAGLI